MERASDSLTGFRFNMIAGGLRFWSGVGNGGLLPVCAGMPLNRLTIYKCALFTCSPIHYRKTHVCRVPNNMHSANNWHSAEYLFAECRPFGTRQRHTLPSAGQLTLGKYRHVHRTHPQTTVTVGAAFVCRVPTRGHSANRSLPSAPQSTLGKLCHVPRTRRCHERSHFSTAVTVIVCRVPAR